MAGATVAEIASNFIGGKMVPATGAETRKIIDPSTREAFAEVASSTAKHADDAVAAALAAAPAWAALTPSERATALLELADVIMANADELAALDQRNVGKPGYVAVEEPKGAADMLRFYAGVARNMGGLATGEYTTGTTSMMRRDPLGVVACIAPWNYPLSTAAARIAPALATGNTVVLKPSELTPLSTLRLAELSVGILPDGVFNVVTGDGHIVGDALASHPDVDMISMTGSAATGQKILRAAAGNFKRVELELGGNAPAVVFEDADIPALVSTLRSAAFWNAGQECGAASRIIVHRSRLEDLLAALVPEVESIVVGDPHDDATEMGPLISEAQLARVKERIAEAVADGARVLTGGHDAGMTHGYYLAPTVVVDAPGSTALVAEETFGPVLTVQTFDDEAEALEMANGTPYALSGSVWTADISRGLRMTKALRAGTAWLNTHLVFSPEIPWGGVGASGGGADGSMFALEAHTRMRNVVIQHG